MWLVQTTASGVETGKWLRRLIEVRERQGVTTGWLFQDSAGLQLPTQRFTEPFYTRLEAARDLHPYLFVDGVNVREDYGPLRAEGGHHPGPQNVEGEEGPGRLVLQVEHGRRRDVGRPHARAVC
jgi:hypothetical protein